MSDFFAELRAREYARLDAGGHVYLDYTGSALYAESLVRRHAEMLQGRVLGNPHSRNPTSWASTEIIEEARERVLAFFGASADEYEVTFTCNATAALKLVGESYPFSAESRLLLTADNHNSVHGVREFAHARGAGVGYVPLNADLCVEELAGYLEGADRSSANLLIYPAQSNFSGVKHPLAWIELAHECGYDVFLDAAAFVPTSRLDLREMRPEFVCVSFYKMFGFPTGVGALLTRKSALKKLRRPWFGGGTVRFVSAQSEVHLLHTTGRGYEDGTPNFLSIAAVPDGLDFLDEIGLERIGAHVMQLTALLLEELQALQHSDGAPMVRIYGPCGREGRGGAVAFNLLDPRGRLVDFRTVEQRANEANVSLRTGFFCNPGAAEFAFEYRKEEVHRCASHFTAETFTIQQFSICMSDKPVGGVRVSLGLPSNEADVRRLLEVLSSFRDASATPSPAPAAAQVVGD